MIERQKTGLCGLALPYPQNPKEWHAPACSAVFPDSLAVVAAAWQRNGTGVLSRCDRLKLAALSEAFNRKSIYVF